MRRFLLWGLAGVALLGVAAPLLLPPGVDRVLNVVLPHAPHPIGEAAKRLHATLQIADLHADTLLWSRDPLARNTHGHVDVPRLSDGNVAVQVLATVTKAPTGENYVSNDDSTDILAPLVILSRWPARTWGSLFERARYQAERAHALSERDPAALRLITTRDDLREVLAARAEGSPVVGVVLATEGSHALEGRLENIAALDAAGFRIMGLHHFFDNALGGSLHGVEKGGLTDFGRAAVAEMLERDIILDLAHSSEAVVDDVLAISDRPVIVSHTGIRGACDSPRNLTDARMRRIARAGGVVGIGFWSGAVCDPSPAGIVRSIRAAIRLLGAEHVALGSDWDGSTRVQLDASELAALTHEMLRQDFSEDEIRGVMGGNTLRLLDAQLPERS